ncbi:nucleotide exchange factor GrpE [Rhodococcus tibetensis]|uniref:Protein GrpE n=1 Tax=Rhodococcus tibetensis TaxID=2965064 RepID=A0ABT1QKF8_9NOCA|nr:nucleotide exchange factor GrpE [Rhodococcus sp. FXJ9.536]MCQ4121572.1 nucleotide exchange factor GrpE [Rhodococcus sp. FXJ9.536]
MSTERANGKESPREPISITDKRRVDPETGQVRERTPSSEGDNPRVAELTADLQRLQAEFANYRRRIERDRHVTADASKIRATLADLGVAAFGEEGDPFDPTLHEAVQHEGGGHELVVGSVLRRGYKFGNRRVLRTATVTVVDAHRP